MSTARLLPPTDIRTRDDASDSAQAARVSFRQPVAKSGFLDAAWWPRSRDLTTELPPLLEVLWTAARDINRITYNITAWDPAPRRMLVENRTVRLGGFTTSDPLTVRLSDAWGTERVDILVIAASTEPAVAQRAMLLTSEADSPYRADEILIRAGRRPRSQA
ncbi:MAG TPA: DUF5994 family protein [Mycobacterium sp.]|jgi:hypothetical protein|nr:DUF5994 family protein [Mycobacterium sp.]